MSSFLCWVRGRYPHYLLDSLPIDGTRQSLLRLDHILAVGSAADNFELTRYQLSPQALEVVYDWVQWLVEGVLADDGLLALLRAELLKIDATT